LEGFEWGRTIQVRMEVCVDDACDEESVAIELCLTEVRAAHQTHPPRLLLGYRLQLELTLSVIVDDTGALSSGEPVTRLNGCAASSYFRFEWIVWPIYGLSMLVYLQEWLSQQGMHSTS
jgi:hypothetical protein